MGFKMLEFLQLLLICQMNEYFIRKVDFSWFLAAICPVMEPKNSLNILSMLIFCVTPIELIIRTYQAKQHEI